MGGQDSNWVTFFTGSGHFKVLIRGFQKLKPEQEREEAASIMAGRFSPQHLPPPTRDEERVEWSELYKPIPVSFKLRHWSQAREITPEIKEMPIWGKRWTKALRREAISIFKSQPSLHKTPRTRPPRLTHCFVTSCWTMAFYSWGADSWLRTYL